MPSLKYLRRLRRRFGKWVWQTSVSCCCGVEQLEDWESIYPEDWEDKFMSPSESVRYEQQFGHLVTVGMWKEWGTRGDFVRALKNEDFLAPGSLLNPHPILRVGLGFRNCELTTGKDYSCYCRVRKIFRGYSEANEPCELRDTECAEEFDECEPMIDGIIASYWVECLDPMLNNLCQLSALRHRRSNFTHKKPLTDTMASDPIHMMYVHIEGMIPQFGPFMLEVWRRNQGLHMGPAGDVNRHGLEFVIPHSRRQTLEAELRQVFPNKSIRLKPPPSMEKEKRGGTSVLTSSSSSICFSTIVGQLADALKKHCGKKLAPFLLTKSATNMNQSAEVPTTRPEAGIETVCQTEISSCPSNHQRGSHLDTLVPMVVPFNHVTPADTKKQKKNIKHLWLKILRRIFRKSK